MQKRQRKIAVLTSVFVILSMILSACSSHAASNDTSDGILDTPPHIGETTQISSASGSVRIIKPDADSSAQESSAPIDETSSLPDVQPTQPDIPSQESTDCDIEMLNIEGNFMKPKSIEGIDPFSDKVVALTFDDGPFKDTTPRLLDILEQNDVNATFFMVGKYADQSPDIVKRAYENGNEIGTHSWDHSSNFVNWTHEETMDQISRANDAIEAATGLRTIIDRPPEGAINEDVAQSIGRMQILWGVDPLDWKKENRDPETVYNNVVNNEDLHDGSIVLSHDIRPTTVDAYDRIIKELKNQGYKFVTVSQLIQIAKLRGKDLSYVFSGSNSAKYAAEHGYTAASAHGQTEASDSANTTQAENQIVASGTIEGD